MENLFAACAECDMPILFHMTNEIGGTYGIVDEAGLRRIEKMLKKYPKLKLIGHSQSFWSEISADVTDETRGGYPQGKITDGRLIALLRECENLYCDLSAGSGGNAVMRDPEYAARFFEEFSDRILYGVDFCHPTNEHPYRLHDYLIEMADSGAISEENYRKVVRDNAIRLLKL
jgi:predicted TIM-barrel fold metal-dependent hydrolase